MEGNRIYGLNALSQPIENIRSYRRTGSAFDGTTISLSYENGEEQSIYDSLGDFRALVSEINKAWEAKRRHAGGRRLRRSRDYKTN